MKKLIFLGLIIVNLAVIGIVLSRRLGTETDASADDAGSTKMDRASADQAPDSRPAARAIELPSRPASLLAAPTDDATREIWQLRNAAFDIAEQAVKKLGSAPGALCLLGKLQLRCGGEAAAQEIWNSVIAEHPKFAEAYLDLGNYHRNNANYPKAQEYLEKTLEQAPESRDALLAMADVLTKQAEADKAREILDELLNSSPSPELWAMRGAVAQLDADWPQAIQDYEKALATAPDFREAVQGLMVAYRQQGNNDQAKAMAQRLGEIERTASRTAESRNVQLRDKRVARELLVFTAQSAADEYLERELVSTTQSMLRKPIEMMPESVQLSALSSRLYFQTQQFDQAIKTLRQLCEVAPDEADNWLRLAETCILCRRMKPAEEALAKAVALEPDRPAAHRMLANARMYDGRNLPGAIQSASKLLELSPTSQSHYLLGTAYFHAGEKDKAIAQLQSALRLSPRDAAIRAALENILRE
ncbi:MAG: hypothetical protein Aurels2KO_42360 [Aureliella sp.]